MLYSIGRYHAEIVRYLVVLVAIIILNPLKPHTRWSGRVILRLAGVIKRIGLDLAVVYMGAVYTSRDVNAAGAEYTSLLGQCCPPVGVYTRLSC